MRYRLNYGSNTGDASGKQNQQTGELWSRVPIKNVEQLFKILTDYDGKLAEFTDSNIAFAEIPKSVEFVVVLPLVVLHVDYNGKVEVQ